ncbi:MAG: hypothetical protein JNL38_04045 [Myxococcales bacterium]|jgi:hypothetical protein|nr:hypothetical protein [Myxococcales bacterium]
MQGGYPAAGYGSNAAYGRVEVNLSFNPLAWILTMVTPQVVINGQRYPAKWGRNHYDLPPGNYRVEAFFPYMFSDRAGAAVLDVAVHASYATVLTYDAPFLMWDNGTMRHTGNVPMQLHV